MTNNNDNQLYVARNKDNSLIIFVDKPIRNKILIGCWGCMDNPYRNFEDNIYMELDNNLFPELKWEDEPIPVKIVSLQLDEKKLAKKTLEEALAAKFCGFIPEGETPGMTDLNIFEYAYKLGVINTLGLFKMPKDLMTIAQMEKENEKDNNETN